MARRNAVLEKDSGIESKLEESVTGDSSVDESSSVGQDGSGSGIVSEAPAENREATDSPSGNGAADVVADTTIGNGTGKKKEKRLDAASIALQNEVTKNMTDFVNANCAADVDGKILFSVFKSEFNKFREKNGLLPVFHTRISRSLAALGFTKEYSPDCVINGLKWEENSGIENYAAAKYEVDENGKKIRAKKEKVRTPVVPFDRVGLVQEFVNERMAMISGPSTNEKTGKEVYTDRVSGNELYEAFLAWGFAHHKPGFDVIGNSHISQGVFSKIMAKDLGLPRIYAGGFSQIGGYALTGDVPGDRITLLIGRISGQLSVLEEYFQKVTEAGEEVNPELLSLYDGLRDRLKRVKSGSSPDPDLEGTGEASKT